MTQVTMKQMLEAGVHFGHKTRYWNPDMSPYIYGARHGIHIIDLGLTLPKFRDALDFVRNLVENRGKVLFVGTKFAARDMIREQATRCGMPYVDYRWLGGMLTNYKTIRRSIKRLKELEELLGQPTALEGKTKKEVLMLMREKDKLSNCLGGIKNMGSLPDVLFVIDVNNERIAIQEAKRLGIPVIGIVDTNSSPNGIDIMIPGNDDAMRAVKLYSQCMADVIIEARSVVTLADEKKKAAIAAKAPPKKIVSKKSALKEAATATEGDAKPAAKKVAAKTKAVATESAESAPEAKKPAAKKVAAKKPAAKKAAAKKPAAKKVAAKAKKTDDKDDSTSS